MKKSPEISAENYSFRNDLSELKNTIAWYNESLETNDNKWLEDICDSAISELEGKWDSNDERRAKRNMKLDNIWNNTFELESYGWKMVIDNNFIYDITDWSRMEVMELGKDVHWKLYDSAWCFIKNNENKEIIKSIMLTMNLINRLRYENFSRKLRYERGEWWIYAGWFFNDTLVVKKEKIDKRSKDMGMDDYEYSGKICEYLNNKVKKLN